MQLFIINYGLFIIIFSVSTVLLSGEARQKEDKISLLMFRRALKK